MGNSFFWLTALVGLVCAVVGWVTCHFWGWRAPEELVVRRIVEESSADPAESSAESSADVVTDDVEHDVVAQVVVADAPPPPPPAIDGADDDDPRIEALTVALRDSEDEAVALRNRMAESDAAQLASRSHAEAMPTGNADHECKDRAESAESQVEGWAGRVAELESALAAGEELHRQAMAELSSATQRSHESLMSVREHATSLEHRIRETQLAHSEAEDAMRARVDSSEQALAVVHAQLATSTANAERAVSDWRARYAALESEVGRSREWEGRYRALEGERDRMRADLEARLRALMAAGSAGSTGSEHPDDLLRIEGIGPKINSALMAAGITRFEHVRDRDEGALRAAIREAGISFAPSIATWADQARHLADGDSEGFQRLVRSLVAGRRARGPRPASTTLPEAHVSVVVELPAAPDPAHHQDA